MILVSKFFDCKHRHCYCVTFNLSQRYLERYTTSKYHKASQNKELADI